MTHHPLSNLASWVEAPSDASRTTALLGRALLCGALVLGATGWLAGCSTTKDGTSKISTADEVVVDKSERRLRLLKGGKVMREYRVALGKNPVGPKLREGDQRTPEGEYVLDWRNHNSQYYKALHVSYPNDEDRSRAQEAGAKPGGMIMIHGKPNYVKSPAILAEYDQIDWTNGCIAVSNNEMDEIWRAVKDGTKIRIQP